jgi:hypothetical protein
VLGNNEVDALHRMLETASAPMDIFANHGLIDIF